jgi:hypothetical protein
LSNTSKYYAINHFYRAAKLLINEQYHSLLCPNLFTFLKICHMPQSRKRPGHHEYRKPADIPATQRSRGRITWAILLGIFGGLIAFFAAPGNYVVLVIGLAIGAALGYSIGKNMEKERA